MNASKWKKLAAGSSTESASNTVPDSQAQETLAPSKLRVLVPYCVVLALLVLLLTGLFNVWTRMDQVQLGYEISNLQTKNKELKDRVRELSLELSSLESPAELEKMAKKQGLRLPSVGRIIHVPK
jgi:cell division protein FtsL